jgi:amino acid transporter
VKFMGTPEEKTPLTNKTEGPDDGNIHPELEWRSEHARPGTGDRHIRLVRPYSRYFRRVGPGQLTSTERVLTPRDTLARLGMRVKRVLIGPPLATAEEIHERLTKVKALAVFSSDALSSSAYATEEILLQLIIAGTAALAFSVPISLAIALLLAIVAFSYRQTVRAYPKGGGSYIVAKDNLGTGPALVAGASLLTDYILTVAVSISAGVAAVTSAFPVLYPYRVLLGAAAITFMVLANLRGIRESGNIFAAPTYLFIFSFATMIVVGLFKSIVLGAPPTSSSTPVMTDPMQAVTIALILRAFAAGAVALTGTEAIADGVPAFKPPEAKNAATTLAWMAAILASFFIGLSILAHRYGIAPVGHETVVSQVARAVFDNTWFYYVIQASTALILVLAANTAFADFPRLASFLARDGFLPRQFTFRGDRLAFSVGIVLLGIVATTLLVLFRGETHGLIPLYAVGVFMSFTLSQTGMVVHWWRRREAGWQRSMIINLIGATMTGIVLIVVAVVKFPHGAWVVVFLIPLLVLLFTSIERHYRRINQALKPSARDSVVAAPARPMEQPVIVPVPGITKPVLRSLNYARSISHHVTAVHVTDDLAAGQHLREEWERQIPDVPLVILESPYRSFLGPMLAYVDAIDQQALGLPVTVIISETVSDRPWERFLHNQTARQLKEALFNRPNTVVISIPYRIPQGPAREVQWETDERGGEAEMGWEDKALGLMLSLIAAPVGAFLGFFIGVALEAALEPGDFALRETVQAVSALVAGAITWVWYARRGWHWLTK